MEDRLLKLETIIAHQDRLLDEINVATYQMENRIRRLEETLKNLHQKVNALQASEEDQPMDDSPPPHYNQPHN